MESEKVKELAESLKKQGLAASMYEAMEKAKRIIGNEKIEKVEGQKERLKQEQQITEEEGKEREATPKDTEKFEQPDYDISKEEVTLNELMKEIGVNPEEVKETENGRVEEEAEILKKEVKEEKKEEEQKIKDTQKSEISGTTHRGFPTSKSADFEEKEKLEEFKEKVKSEEEETEESEEER